MDYIADETNVYIPNEWLRRHMEGAVIVALTSIVSRSVGAVIVSNDEVIAKACNVSISTFTDLEELREVTEHAERAAIFDAAARGVSLAGAIMFVTHHPCSSCARAIVLSGIRKVYYGNGVLDARWSKSCALASRIFHSAGVVFEYVPFGKEYEIAHV